MVLQWAKDLPPELWRVVFGFIPKAEAPSCMPVCRLLHDLALEKLFCTVELEFGCWEIDYGWKEWEDNDARSASQRAARRSYEILLRIITDTHFAGLVRELGVLPYTKQDATFETCCLVQAVSTLHNLRSFTWYISLRSLDLGPSLPRELIDTLYTSCPNLKLVDIPLRYLPGLSLHRLTRLTDIDLPIDGDVLDVALHRSDYQALLEANCTTVVGLRVPSPFMHETPRRVLENLTHLNLQEGDTSSTALVLRHCACLTSLTIGGDVEDHSPFFTALADDSTTLLHLQSFKLILSCDPGTTGTQSLSQFLLRHKKTLRRFDMAYARVEWPDMLPLLETYSDMSELRVLGLEVLLDDLTTDDLALIGKCLPPALTALRLRLDYIETPAIPSSSWIDLWAHFPHLAFIHMDDNGHAPVFTSEELATYATSVVFLVHRGRFTDVARVDGAVRLSAPWSPWKVMWSVDEDYGSGDWKWLIGGNCICVGGCGTGSTCRFCERPE